MVVRTERDVVGWGTEDPENRIPRQEPKMEMSADWDQREVDGESDVSHPGGESHREMVSRSWC